MSNKPLTKAADIIAQSGQKKAQTPKRETAPARIPAKKYRVLDVKNEKRVTITACPDKLVTEDERFEIQFINLLETANRESMTRNEKILLHEALYNNGITIDEAYKAFWAAYGDPYMSAGTIRFRNLMHAIKEHRKQARYYTHAEICELADKGKASFDDFEMAGKNGSNGKPLWIKITDKRS